MNFISAIKDIIIYKEPQNNQVFELLEDEQEDWGKTKSGKKDANAGNSAKGDENGNENNDKNNNEASPGKGLIRPLKRILRLGKKGKESEEKGNKNAPDNREEKNNFITRDLMKNLDTMKREFNFPLNQDVIIREFKIMQQTKAFIIYIDGMADKITINDYILRQLMAEQKNTESKHLSVDYICDNLLTINQINKEKEFDQTVRQILNGLTALFVEGNEECIVIESRGYEKRGITTPITETVIKGPHEAFVENLRTNLTLVRRIIRNKDLVTEMLPLGKADNLLCAVLYVEGICNPKIVQEVKRRIKSLNIDFIPGNGELDQLIEDHPFALFPQILNTERPDRTASFLMDGKVALICDGSPLASIVPITFFHLLHTSEDTSLRWQYGTFLRLIRLFASFVAVFLPGLYIALTLYHHEMIPTELLYSLTRARENIPFPTVLELFLMELSFELIREAGLRIPGVIGQTLGIIGAVILGQAAVSAGIVSPFLIIIVAITGLGSFAIPNFSISFGYRLTRFIFLLFGTIAGFYGIAAAIVIIGSLLCSMKSFGVPYFSPVAPATKATPDIGIRGPSFKQKERPDFLNTMNRKRAGNTVRGWVNQPGKGEGK